MTPHNLCKKTQKCNECGQLADYFPHGGDVCRRCHKRQLSRVWTEKNRETIKAKKRAYYEEHRSEILLYQRNRYDNNPDTVARRRRQQLYYQRGEFRDSVGRRPYRMFVRGQRSLPLKVEKEQRKISRRQRKKTHDKMFKQGMKWCHGCATWHPLDCFSDNRRQSYLVRHTKPSYPTYGKYPNCREYERKARRQRWLNKALKNALLVNQPKPNAYTTFRHSAVA